SVRLHCNGSECHPEFCRFVRQDTNHRELGHWNLAYHQRPRDKDQDCGLRSEVPTALGTRRAHKSLICMSVIMPTTVPPDFAYSKRFEEMSHRAMHHARLFPTLREVTDAIIDFLKNVLIVLGIIALGIIIAIIIEMLARPILVPALAAGTQAP